MTEIIENNNEFFPKAFKPYLEGFIGIIIAIVIIWLQFSYIRTFGLFLKSVLFIGILGLILHYLDYFFLKVFFKENFLCIKSIFTLGKTVKLDIKDIKCISTQKIYNKNNINYGYIFIIVNNVMPISIPINLGIIGKIEEIKSKIEETM